MSTPEVPISELVGHHASLLDYQQELGEAVSTDSLKDSQPLLAVINLTNEAIETLEQDPGLRQILGQMLIAYDTEIKLLEKGVKLGVVPGSFYEQVRADGHTLQIARAEELNLNESREDQPVKKIEESVFRPETPKRESGSKYDQPAETVLIFLRTNEGVYPPKRLFHIAFGDDEQYSPRKWRPIAARIKREGDIHTTGATRNRHYGSKLSADNPDGQSMPFSALTEVDNAPQISENGGKRPKRGVTSYTLEASVRYFVSTHEDCEFRQITEFFERAGIDTTTKVVRDLLNDLIRRSIIKRSLAEDHSERFSFLGREQSARV